MKLTKKKVLAISVFVSIVLLIASYFGNVKLCTTGGNWNYECSKFLYLIEMMLLPFWPITVFSLITYPLREEVFQAWMHFAKWWIPLSIFFVLIMPDGQGGGYMPSLIDKQTIAFLMSSIFILVSTIKIISKSIELRKK